MTPETVDKFEALEAQAHALTGLFCKSGFEMVAPAVIQPADVFLNVVGEDLRRRTYVFTDPEGAELCLRPDLTIPTCRLHLQRCQAGVSSVEARYCYNGPAFRFQPSGATEAHPREFRQLGIESFGAADKEADEIEILGLVIRALRMSGLNTFKVRIGDLGIFGALLTALQLPDHWRHRLRAQFWKPEAFRAELRQMATQPDARLARLPQDVTKTLRDSDPEDAPALLMQYLDDAGTPFIGTRTAEEIAESLLDIIADARSEPLSQPTVALIEAYLGIVAPARAAGARLRDLMARHDIDIDGALETYRRRLKYLSDLDIDPARIEFSAEFGRSLDYYTGFVFELSVSSLGPKSPIAGGGRYDTLMRAVGAGADVPAVGAMIHTERLLQAASER
ncbi:MAG: ATP phosphoribosyltransferase regulatory subunit [Hyphomicrobiaceae bacterium]